jgi:hypothetical protein
MSFEEDVEDITPNVMRSQTIGRSPNSTTFVGPAPAMSPVANGIVSPISNDGAWLSASSVTMAANSPVSAQDSQAVITGDPKMLPPQFGFQAKMDNIDRRLFEFCKAERTGTLEIACLSLCWIGCLLTDL